MQNPLRLIPFENNMELIHRRIHEHRYQEAGLLCKGKKTLDLGCGEGYGTFIMNQIGGMAVGLDYDKHVIHNAVKKYGQHYLVGNCIRLSFRKKSFDAVVCFELIEHLREQDICLKAIHRVLKKDGLLILSTPNKDAFQTGNPHHIKELSVNETVTLLEKRGFSIMKIHSYFPRQLKFFWDRLPAVFRENATIVTVFLYMSRYFSHKSCRYPYYVCKKL